MSRLLYENSISYKGHLIIPFIFEMADSQVIYSYKLLSELGHKGKFHNSDNPAGVYSNTINNIIDLARKYLDKESDVVSNVDYFKHRYTYQNNLIIIYEGAGKYFYDPYNPEALNNVAAPKIFKSEQDCINWIKQGLDHSSIDEEVGKV